VEILDTGHEHEKNILGYVACFEFVEHPSVVV
jgi:hypothetical protein